jgi:hypothetical protein
MAGRHRVVVPNRPLSREVGRVGALLLLTAAPLVQVGTASADGTSGPVQERRAQTDDSNRDSSKRDSSKRKSDRDSDDRESSDDRDSDDRRTATRNASSRQRDGSRNGSRSGSRNGSRDDDADDRGYRGRHRADDDDDDDDRGSGRTGAAGTSGDDGPSRKSRTRSAESAGDSSSRKSRTRSVQAAEDSVGTRRARTRAAVSGSVPESRWDRLAQCESRQRWSANTGNGYRGGLQFSDSTWNAYGGGRYAPSAHQASREEQIAVAAKVQREQGWSAWPSCSRQLGYT